MVGCTRDNGQMCWRIGFVNATRWRGQRLMVIIWPWKAKKSKIMSFLLVDRYTRREATILYEGSHQSVTIARRRLPGSDRFGPVVCWCPCCLTELVCSKLHVPMPHLKMCMSDALQDQKAHQWSDLLCLEEHSDYDETYALNESVHKSRAKSQLLVITVRCPI